MVRDTTTLKCKKPWLYVCIYRHTHIPILICITITFLSQEASFLLQAPTVNFLRHWLNLPLICPHSWDHWDGGLEAKHPKPHSQSKTMSPFASLLISSRSYVKPNKVVTWSHSWALQPPGCAMPWHAVPPCQGWQALGNLWDTMAMALHVWSGSEIHAPVGGLAVTDPRDISPCLVLTQCCSWGPGWQQHAYPPAWWHTWCVQEQWHSLCTAGPLRSPEVQKHVFEEGWCCLAT